MSKKPSYEELEQRIKELEKGITDRKLSEEALRESEENYKQLIEQLSDVILTVKLGGRLSYLSPAIKGFGGYTPEEEVGNHIAKYFVNKKELIKALKLIKQIYFDKKPASIEFLFKPLQRAPFYVEVTGRPLIIENKVKSIHCVMRNITDRKRVERALRESESRFRSLVESSPVGMCIIQQNKIVYQNSSLKRLLGPLPKGYENHVLDYLHPDDVEKCKKVYRQITSGSKQTTEMDFRFYPPGKKDTKIGLCWVQCHASFVEYQGMDAILMNMMDITRVKEIEHLLSIKQKMSSLGHVAAGIAHEIRNPLTGINSYLYTLKDLCDSEIIEGDQNVIIKHIISQFQLASDKIEAVIKRVLDFSRPNPPKMNLIDLSQCIESTVKLSSATLSKYDIKLEKSIEPDLLQFYGDFHLVEQVLLNLINNATQVMKNSEKVKRIRIDSFRKNKSIYIQVSDSGPGIPKEIKDQIFDPFFTTSPDGTGIGLSIAQRIIADHHGTIEILQSKWGGSTFRIKLPIEKRTLSR